MKKLLIIAALFMVFCYQTSSQNPKVLMFIQDNSMDLGFMLTNEVGKMKQILEKSGLDVVIASISGEVMKAASVTVTPDIKLSKVNINDYSGFIFPCMAVNDTIVTSEEKSFVKKVVNEGKPIAAQNGGVLILASAGVLNGKKYALEGEFKGLPEFKSAIYIGTGVVRDGNIITSGTCPMMAKETGRKDGTEELTQKLVQAIKAKI